MIDGVGRTGHELVGIALNLTIMMISLISRVCSVVAPDDICVCGVQGPVNFNRVIQFAVVMALTARVSLFVASELVMGFLKGMTASYSRTCG